MTGHLGGLGWMEDSGASGAAQVREGIPSPRAVGYAVPGVVTSEDRAMSCRRVLVLALLLTTSPLIAAAPPPPDPLPGIERRLKEDVSDRAGLRDLIALAATDGDAGG